MNVPDLIRQLVVSMRQSGMYNSAVQIGDTWSVAAANNLQTDEWVEIDGSSYKVVAAAPTTFTVLAVAIPLTGSWVAKAPYYEYGDGVEIDATLINKKGEPFKHWKYPMVMLRMPSTDKELDTGLHELRLNLLIVMYTSKTYNSDQRYANVITPILEPLYDLLFARIRSTGLFHVLGPIPHTRIDRLFYGTQGRTRDKVADSNIASVFSDPLDAIEIFDLKLKVLKDNC